MTTLADILELLDQAHPDQVTLARDLIVSGAVEARRTESTITTERVVDTNIGRVVARR